MYRQGCMIRECVDSLGAKAEEAAPFLRANSDVRGLAPSTVTKLPPLLLYNLVRPTMEDLINPQL